MLRQVALAADPAHSGLSRAALEDALIADYEEAYVRSVVRLAVGAKAARSVGEVDERGGDGEKSLVLSVRQALCGDGSDHRAWTGAGAGTGRGVGGADVLFNDTRAIREWEVFLYRAAAAAVPLA